LEQSERPLFHPDIANYSMLSEVIDEPQKNTLWFVEAKESFIERCLGSVEEFLL
jgi:hypothetical protein